jgi:hypothetical protein
MTKVIMGILASFAAYVVVMAFADGTATRVPEIPAVAAQFGVMCALEELDTDRWGQAPLTV